MCGIWAAITGKHTIGLEEYMSSGFMTLNHRGPDSSGRFTRENVSIGHTRLKVIDLSDRASQPMVSPDGDIVIAFNGEVFNFKELRKALSGRGYAFFSDSDTEVVLCAYREWGQECFKRFNGMFALAIADYKRRKFIAAIDRFRIKPLYYTFFRGQFFISSEMKMFLNLPGFVPKINEAVLGELFTYRCLSGEQTLMDGVYTLEPGFFVTVDMADPLKFDKKSYWCLERDIRDIVYEDAIQKTLELLKDSLRLRKISDVPHGLLLSGGLDSSILAAFDKELSKELLMTFTVGFEEDAFDESPYFTFVSEKYNTRHRSYVFNQSEIVDCYKKCIWHLEESINHPHTPLIYLISKEIKTYVTVLLTGEASDEIFAGYARYLDAHHAISNGAGADATILNSSSLMTPEVLERLLPSKRHRASIAARQDLIKNTEGMSFLQRLQFYDLKTYLPSLLTRLDKMTMASSIEARVPFMDWRLVQFAFSLPDAYKINQNVTKAILKDIAKVYFPHEFVHRPKVGFRTPFRSWLRANGCFKDILLKEESPADGFLNQSYLSSVAKRFFDGDDSFECSDVVWSVMNLKIWCRLFLEGEGKLQSS